MICLSSGEREFLTIAQAALLLQGLYFENHPCGGGRMQGRPPSRQGAGIWVTIRHQVQLRLSFSSIKHGSKDIYLSGLLYVCMAREIKGPGFVFFPPVRRPFSGWFLPPSKYI